MKKFRIHWLFSMLLLAVGLLGAQNSIENFAPQKSQGPMPDDLKKITNQDVEWEDYGVLLKELVMEGSILYGTSLNEYVNTVADNLLQDEPALRSKIHIYIVKSPMVNAFTTYNGLVLIPLGTLAQISNESELAFILAHEFAHVAEQHVTKYGIKDKPANRDLFDYYMRMQSTSRSHEFAADRIALERFIARTSYSYEAVDALFDVMLYSDLPFDEIPFPKSLVETDFYHFPNDYFLTNTASISNRADAVDTLSTHPNIEKRRAALADILASKSNEGRFLFLQSEQLFYEVRELARFECINVFLTEHQYDHAFYNTYVLLQSHPDNKFLNEALAAAVYGFSKHKNYRNSASVIQNYKNVEGEMQQTCYFLSKLTRQESSLLALRLAWNAREKDPGNQYLTDILKDAMKDVFVKNKMKYQDFSDFPMGSQPDSSLLTPSEPTDAPANKYERIRQQNRKTLVSPTEKFKTANYMLVDIHQNDLFSKMVASVVNQAEDDEVMDFVSSRGPVAAKSMLVATPTYETPYNEEKSDKCVRRLQKTLKTCLRRLKITNEAYTVEDVCDFTTDQYNGYAELQQWQWDFQQSDGVEMVLYSGQDMGLATELTRTSLVVMADVLRSKYGFVSTDKSAPLVSAVLCPYVLPMGITLFALPRYQTEMKLVVADFQTGKTLYVASDRYLSAMSDAYVNSFVYDQLYHFVKGK